MDKEQKEHFSTRLKADISDQAFNRRTFLWATILGGATVGGLASESVARAIVGEPAPAQNPPEPSLQALFPNLTPQQIAELSPADIQQQAQKHRMEIWENSEKKTSPVGASQVGGAVGGGLVTALAHRFQHIAEDKQQWAKLSPETHTALEWAAGILLEADGKADENKKQRLAMRLAQLDDWTLQAIHNQHRAELTGKKLGMGGVEMDRSV